MSCDRDVQFYKFTRLGFGKFKTTFETLNIACHIGNLKKKQYCETFSKFLANLFDMCLETYKPKCVRTSAVLA